MSKKYLFMPKEKRGEATWGVNLNAFLPISPPEVVVRSYGLSGWGSWQRQDKDPNWAPHSLHWCLRKMCLFHLRKGLKVFPGGSVIKNLPAIQEMWVRSLGREGSLERQWQPTPVFLPGESHGQRILVRYSTRGRTRVGHNLGTKQKQQQKKGDSKCQQQQNKDSLRSWEKIFFSAHKPETYCLFVLSNALTQRHLPLQFNTFVLSSQGCSDTIMKLMYPNAVRKLSRPTKAEGCVSRYKVPHEVLDERWVSKPSCFYHD